MSLASLCHHYMLTVICRLPISPLSSQFLKTSVSSVAFCKHQVTQQLVGHLALWGLTNRPPWLNTRSTGANVQAMQKILSNSGFKQTNCLLSLTRHHGLPTSVPTTISCTYARHELTTIASWTPFSADEKGLKTLKTFLSRPRPRPRLMFLSSRRLETKTLVSRTTSLQFNNDCQ